MGAIDTQRQRLHALKQAAQARYALPDLGPKYQDVYEKAEKLLKARRISEKAHTEKFEMIIAEMRGLEQLAAERLQKSPEPVEERSAPIVKRKRGGRRAGAGRKGHGLVRRNLTLGLPPGYWETIDRLQETSGRDLTGLIRSIVVASVDAIERGGIDEVVCPVCDGSGAIQPGRSGKTIVCPRCEGEKRLKQIKFKE